MLDDADSDAVSPAITEHDRDPIWTGSCGSHSAPIPWFVAETHRHDEARALHELGNQGFTAYLPEVLERRTKGERTRIERVLMFPGYVFVQLDLAAPGWRAACHTRGIARFLGRTPEHPQPLPTDCIAMVRENAAARNAALDELLRQPVEAGQRVMVKVGPWAGLDGVCLWSRKDRIRVLLTLLGKPHEVEMALSRVERT